MEHACKNAGTKRLRSIECDSCSLGNAYRRSSMFCPRLARRVVRGEILCRTEDTGDKVWFVKKGLFAIEHDGCTTLLFPGDMISQQDLSRHSDDAVVRALTPGEACWAPPWRAEEYVEPSKESMPWSPYPYPAK